jgi:hypothetical protein
MLATLANGPVCARYASQFLQSTTNKYDIVCARASACACNSFFVLMILVCVIIVDSCRFLSWQHFFDALHGFLSELATFDAESEQDTNKMVCGCCYDAHIDVSHLTRRSTTCTRTRCRRCNMRTTAS